MGEISNLIEHRPQQIPRIPVAPLRVILLDRRQRRMPHRLHRTIDTGGQIGGIISHLRLITPRRPELRAKLIVIAVPHITHIPEHPVNLIRMALRQQARILHLQAVPLLHKPRQQQPVDIHVRHLPQHRHPPFFRQVQEIRFDMQPLLLQADMHHDGTVRNIKLRTLLIPVLLAESGIQIIQQQMESTGILFFLVLLDASVVRIP